MMHVINFFKDAIRLIILYEIMTVTVRFILFKKVKFTKHVVLIAVYQGLKRLVKAMYKGMGISYNYAREKGPVVYDKVRSRFS